MAVYTPVATETLAAFLSDFNVGTLTSAKGIAEGVENSNYLVATSGGRFILTLYEKRVDTDDLPYFLGLMTHLAQAGLPVPLPIANHEGAIIHQLAGRSACLIQFLDGLSVSHPTLGQIAATGTALARMRQATQNFNGRRDNDLSIAGWRRLASKIGDAADTLDPGLSYKIAQSITLLESQWPARLPQSVIHADLFPDNVLFAGAQISGIIDFYFACNDIAAYDLAVALNAWCFDDVGSMTLPDAIATMLAGYEQLVPLEERERAALPLLGAGAALRFLLTRTYDWLNTPPGSLVSRKDPLPYLRRLTWWLDHRHAFA